ncbi:hypothetical protein Rhe02_34960 [Rhizocola hellebori]|uniref:Gram-positive cocci surface proteins LPxTG domain-containing protein n=1 Tax=Rhizocola hellebori TaxID=1392758 RepID=A0A8J3Q7I4_9ACTN|nr:ALF repeat-containing protein [Rhizocola hellebori]GIH05429.1 hypothetical protein Rhe02_34960 [Rhizocola hellebori]
MRWKLPAGLAVLILLILAAPSAAQAGSPGLNEACQTIDRPEYRDMRKLIDIDLDTATDIEVRVRANQILSAARAESLPRLPDATQQALDGSKEDLRAFLKNGMQIVWSDDLLVLITRTLSGGGPKVKAAASKALDENTVETSLAYLNDGLYVARELDCQPPPSTTSPAPAGGQLPKTGTATAALALGGAALVALGIGAVLVGRRSRA